MNELFVFFKEWFSNLKKHTYKVEVVGGVNAASGSSEGKHCLAAIEKTDKNISRRLDVLNSTVRDVGRQQDISFLEPALRAVIKALSNKPKNSDNGYYLSMIDRLDKLVRAVSSQKVEIPAYPKQDPMDLSPVVKGLQVVVDSIEGLKLELESKSLGGSGVVSGSTGSYKEKTKGTILYDASDDQPTYIGTHEDSDADTSDLNWEILKNTYSGSAVTKTVKKKGSWDNRASLF